MSYSEHEYTYHRHTADDGTSTFYRVHIEPDLDASSPRQDSNVSTLVTAESRYESPDGNPCDFPSEYLQPHGVELRRAQVYAALFLPDVLYVTGLTRGGWQGEALQLHDRDDNRLVGLAYVTAKDWADCMGEDTPIDGAPWLLTKTGQPDPNNTEGNRIPSAREAIEQEIESYNHWASGEYVGYIVEQAKKYTADDGDVTYLWGDPDDDLGSCWGFEDADYAREEALETLPPGTVTLSPDEYAELVD